MREIKPIEDETGRTIGRLIKCDCGAWAESYGPGVDADCERCGAWYNAYGQRLRDDIHYVAGGDWADSEGVSLDC